MATFVQTRRTGNNSYTTRHVIIDTARVALNQSMSVFTNEVAAFPGQEDLVLLNQQART